MRKVERIDPTKVDALRLRDALASALSGGSAVALAPITNEQVPDDLALLIETGGSTGKPKVVGLSAAAMRASARLSNQVLGANPHDRWSLALPLHHIAGINQLLRAIDLGTDPVSAGGEYISVVPTQLYRALRDGAESLGRLKMAKAVLIGGAAVPKELVAVAKEVGIPLVTSYGMTEMCGGCIYDGIPLPGVEISINDQNTIALKGPMRAQGYFEDIEGTERAFVGEWFITSDEGEIGADGRLLIHGRSDDVIISGGEKISPALVAEFLRAQFPQTELHVLGIPDKEWGEALRVVMVKSPEISTTSLAQIRQFVGESINRVAAPRSLLLLSEMPIKANGKLDIEALVSAPATEAI